MQFPRITPAIPSRIRDPFDGADWTFELKYDGFRGLAYVDGTCSLVSRNGHTFRSWPTLCAEISAALCAHQAVLDGEIVCLDAAGRPDFNSLLFRRTEPCYATFDCLWLDGEDLRALPLRERKRRLEAVIPATVGRVFRVRSVEANGVDLFRVVCEHDIEGVVAKLGSAPYGTEPPSWLKVKNPAYSQAIGRHDFFDRRRRAARSAGQKRRSPPSSW